MLKWSNANIGPDRKGNAYSLELSEAGKNPGDHKALLEMQKIPSHFSS